MGKETGSQGSWPIIWVIGSSVLMDGVAACLSDRQIKNLVRWDNLSADLDVHLATSKPDLILFELDTPISHQLLDLLKRKPGIHLLGINRSCSQVIVLNSFKRTTRTMTDLSQIVQEIASGGERVPEGGQRIEVG